MSEKSAIIVCCLLVAVVTIPLLLLIQTLSTLAWSGTMVYQLLNGEGLFDDEHAYSDRD
jgi:hypothetical protein